MCFDPPDDAPAVAPLPARQAGHVTFCSFNNPAKVNQEAVRLWAQVLAALPGSRMLLAYRGFEAASVQARIGGWFAARGIAAGRVAFLGAMPRRDFLARYAMADIALDPLPYSGSTTTCEALWMGVPVITLPGQSFAGRHSLSFLSTVGLTETIAADPAHYVAIATALAGDFDRLGALRVGLRARVARSPLCDGPRFAANLAAALRGHWRDWCAAPAGAMRPRQGA
jgi:predicted O-linked N-acetylglucosamine transferase (SPINDLY family)